MTTDTTQAIAVTGNSDLDVMRPPDLVLAEAKRAADVLQRFIRGKANPVVFNGEQYIEFEDWQFLGKFYGFAAKVVSTTPVEFGEVRGFEARAVALDVKTGMEVSAADAMCLNDEDKWSSRQKYEWHYLLKDGTKQLEDPGADKITWVENPSKPGSRMPKRERVNVGVVPVPMFQLRSMAQTRACAKSLRNILAWVAVIAGFKATPVEEMTGYEGGGEHDAKPKIAMPQAEKTAEQAPATAKAKDAGNESLDRSKMRAMESRYEGKCAECGLGINKGDNIFYDAATKKAVHHAPCMADA